MKYDWILVTKDSYLCTVLDSYRYRKELAFIDNTPYYFYSISDKTIKSSERGLLFKDFLLSESGDSYKDSYLGTSNNLYAPIMEKYGHQAVGVAVSANGKESYCLYPLLKDLLKTVPNIFEEAYSRFKTVDLWWGDIE